MRYWPVVAAALTTAGCADGSSGFAFPPDDAGTAGQGPDLAGQLTAAVSVLVEPGPGMTPVKTAIGTAQRTVDVATYLLTDDGVVAELVGAKRGGRAVRVILERSPMGGSNAAAYSALSGAGVLVTWGNPGFTFTHAKFLILDGKELWAMTMNLSSSAPRDNREYLLRDTEASDVAAAQRVFDADWARAGADPGPLVVAPDNARARLDALIDGAERTLDVEWEALSDDDIGAHLARRAKAGVAVRVVAPSQIDPASATRSLLGALRAGGVQVRLLANPYVHAKLILADRGRGFIGSENGTQNSLDHNRELGVAWANPTVAQEVGGVFDQDFAAGQPLF